MAYLDYFSRQARKPTGLFGRFFMSRVFDKGNKVLNTGMLKHLAVEEEDCILEIGFGTGEVIRRMADAITTGLVEGIDFSPVMVQTASRRNRHHLESGRVALSCGNFDDAPYHAGSYDKICSANTLYFWPDPQATSAKIHRLLKPGGSLVLAFVGAEKMRTMPLSKDIFRSYSPEEVGSLLQTCGFDAVQTHTLGPEMYCVEARKGHGHHAGL